MNDSLHSRPSINVGSIETWAFFRMGNYGGRRLRDIRYLEVRSLKELGAKNLTLQGGPNILIRQWVALQNLSRMYSGRQKCNEECYAPLPEKSGFGPQARSYKDSPLPDLSPVEHVWDQLKGQMPSFHSVHDLELAVKNLWAHLPQDNIRCLINSMPDRVAACIAAGGGPTRY
ncbi:transposable element Tcb2 transposase [Trichonephila clavipes]|nr:transposable element Tcb2 transposase [Trichonephila clavipes]